MNVFWDGYGMENPFSGVFVHARSLWEELHSRGLSPTILGEGSELQAFWPQTKVASLPFSRGILPTKWGWSARSGLWLRRHRVSGGGPLIYHGLANWNVPLLWQPACRKVLTVHDLIPLLAPDSVSRAHYWQLKTLLPRAIQAADKIVCVSEWTRQTLAERYPVAREKSVVIPNAFPAIQPRRPGRIDLSAPRLLTVSRFEPYKNFDLIVRLLPRLPREYRWTVVTNAAGEGFLREALPAEVQEGRLIIKTRILTHEMGQLIGESHLYVHPSFLEGFCLPAAESLATGIGVVCVRGSGIDEVVEQRGRGLARQSSVEAWLEAIEVTLQESAREAWQYEHQAWLAARWTWKQAAEALVNVYDGLMKQ
jgi:glycosyltransferase involved in cell wall biosynthesis